ncbi:GNAT family N-acetyltransferase [Kangiella sp.]|uniref:GNAT family N-acetyltransferase n=1 Tax=Kangiella sp. TaxID=1920245 RepID=UPI0019AF563F|nr:GNAT family N-acetyltransferase [Kangiella sp.]MBD3652777.1 GNAT family N-acetyltransferase [Kangiella sp.]
MQSILITKANESDLTAIANLADIIWREHYTPIIGPEQVEYMLGKFQSASAMSQQLLEGVDYYSLWLDDLLIGYLSFYTKGDALFLSKIYVLSQLRGQGIGQQAVDFVKQQAQSKGLDRIQLTVNKYNTGSITAYERMGFKKTEEVVMDIGGGFVMDDYVMEFFLNDS